MGLLPLSAVEGASNEASLRVAFVYKFIKFIEWPNQAANPSFRLCVLGAIDDAKAALQPLDNQPVITQIVDGKQVVNQAIELVYLDDPGSALQKLKSCQMLYRPVQSVPIAIPHPLPAGVFFVADDPEPSEANVGIGMMRNKKGLIEFSISTTAATQAGVSISSQLMKLAKNINGGRG